MQELVKTGTEGLYEQGEEAAKNAERRDYGTRTYTIDYGDTPFGAAKEASAASHADQQQMVYYENTGKVYTENEYVASQETYKSEKYPEPEEIVTEENINEVSEEESVKGADMYENADDMFEVQKQAAATAHDDAMAIVDAINNEGNRKDRIDTVTLASGAIGGLGASAHKWQDEVVKEGAKRGTKRVISEVMDSGISGTVAKGKTAINQISESITPYMSKEGITRVVKGGKNAYSERGITGLFDYINEGTGSVIDSVDMSKVGTAEDSAGGFRRLLGASKNTANEFIEAFKKVDVILTPSTVGVAFPIKQTEEEINANKDSNALNDFFVCPANMAGLPAISVPFGFSSTGLPIGMQFIGNYFDEQSIFNFGLFIEENLK